MRNKTRFQYVDQLRKINCLQKILPIQNLFPDNNEDSKVDNNKFIRYRQWQDNHSQSYNQDYLFNDIVSQYVHTTQHIYNDKFKAQSQHISKDLKYYNDWSESLNQQIKSRDYKFKFYFKESQPPPRLKQESNKDKQKGLNDEGQGIGQKNENNENNQEETNIALPGRKYNFYEITKYIELNNMDKDDKENNFLRDLTIKNQILQLRKLKNLQQIQKIDDFNQEFNKFSYYIQPPQQHLHIDFVDNSVIRQNSTLSFDYFRDIGMPSRNIKDYTIKYDNQMKAKQDEEDATDIHNEYNQEKRQLLYLYFLKEQELKINKSQISFFDIANISMGRITSRNVHMCVRSQKVTKAQYLKLLKKLQKYDLRQNETGKPKNDKQVGTEQLQLINIPLKKQQDDQQKRQHLNFQNLIDQINKIRKQTKLLQQKNSIVRFNKSNFNNQIYMKLQGMLNTLFEMVTDKLPIKYSINQIGDHLQQIENGNDIGSQRLKLLWFVTNCYNELQSKRSKQVDLRSMMHKTVRQDPLLTKYKGNKMIKQQTIQPKQVYGFNIKNKQKEQNTKSNKTPIKTNHNQSTFTRTPTKYSNHLINKALTSTVTNKFAYTAKK